MKAKPYLLTIVCALCIQAVFGQNESKESEFSKADSAVYSGDRDTIEIRVDNKKKKLEVVFEEGKAENKTLKDGDYKSEKEEDLGFYGGVTFARFDLGLAKLIDNGSLTLSDANSFLDYRSWKSINLGFDLLKLGYKVSHQFRIYASAGFDWTHFRLNKNVIILEDTTPLAYTQSSISYRKNRFSSSYIRIPISFEFSSQSEDKFADRFRVSAGPVFGILIQGSQKFISSEDGKQKSIDTYNYAPFRYGGFARIGYGGVGVYVKYYKSTIFVNSPTQDDLKNLSFGLTFLF